MQYRSKKPLISFLLLPLLFFLGCILSHARTITDLSGEWTFSFEKEPPVTVQVPHTWNAKDGMDGPDFTKNKGKVDGSSVDADTYKRGTGTYTKELKMRPQKDKRYFLFFEGASRTCDVLVNGKKAGTHKGAFTAFCFEITPLLDEKGKNTVTVHVDNRHTMDISPVTGDFTLFGGLYRPARLIETDDICIQPDYFASPGVFISQEKVSHSEATVRVDTLVSSSRSSSDPVKVEITIFDPRGYIAAYSSRTLTPEQNETIRDSQELTLIHPLLWQGRDNPYLHKVRVTLTGSDGRKDEVEQPLGIRSATIEPQKGFVLNDYYYKLQGVNRHQDRAGKGWALSQEEEKQDMNLITEMGATALRTLHYPQSKNLYDLCDQAGLVVWTEIPLTIEENNTPAFRENLRQQITEMVLQLGNHPSICMWGIFNTLYSCEEPSAGTVLAEIQDHLQKLDPRRPTIGATALPENNVINTKTDHLAFEYNLWEKRTLNEHLDDLSKRYPDKGIALGTYSYKASINKHENPVKQPEPNSRWFTEEWQTLGMETCYETVKNNPRLWGSFVDMFDFGSDIRTGGETPGIADSGLVTYDRKTPKDAYYFYKANWNQKLMAHIASSRFLHRAQQEIPVKVYSNAEEVTLAVNGQKLPPRTPDELKRALWEKVKLNEGENILEITATRNGETVRDQCKWIYAPAGNPPEDEYDAAFQKDVEELPVIPTATSTPPYPIASLSLL